MTIITGHVTSVSGHVQCVTAFRVCLGTLPKFGFDNYVLSGVGC